MGTLLLKLAGPLQSWGSDSRFVERKTRHEPTKSGVIGLLASALGRRRTDSVDDLCAFTFGVRVDQPGEFERDFQTMHVRVWDKDSQAWTFGKGKLSYRYYLSDAIFVAGLEMPDERLNECAEALLHPVFPLYLGRRSCPPSDKVLLCSLPGVGLLDALASTPWQASDHYRKHLERRGAIPDGLDIYRDTLSNNSEQGETLRDVPESFSQEHREYMWRTIVHDVIPMPLDGTDRPDIVAHDPWAALGEEMN